jgi:hypothetical protein
MAAASRRHERAAGRVPSAVRYSIDDGIAGSPFKQRASLSHVVTFQCRDELGDLLAVDLGDCWMHPRRRSQRISF